MKTPLETPYKVPSHRLVKNGGLTFEIGSNDPFTGISIEYDLNGQPKEKTNYIDGKREGLSERFHENGQLGSRENYKDGEMDGLWERYDENGEDISNNPYQSFHDNGELKEKGNFKDGKEDGHWKYFDEDGNLTKIRKWKDGKELSETRFTNYPYHDNGQLQSTEKEDNKDGLWEWFVKTDFFMNLGIVIFLLFIIFSFF